jgi:hypothetical protein
MIEFLSGLAIGLVFAYWLGRRVSAQQTTNNMSIYEGWLTPDENGNLGHGYFQPNRFPDAGGTDPALSKVNQPITEGKTNKGGRNTFPSQITTRPPPPDPYGNRRQDNTKSTKDI